MMRALALALATLLLAAACSTGQRPLPKPDGQVFRLNPERWDESVNDLTREAAR